MSRRIKVLKTPYSAYQRAHTDAFDEELCRVGRGTPAGSMYAGIRGVRAK